MHRPEHEIMTRLKQWHTYTIDLGRRDSSWNPLGGSCFTGPCRVIYTQLPYGLIDAHVTQAAQ